MKNKFINDAKSRVFILKVWPEKYDAVSEHLKGTEFLGIEHDKDVWSDADVLKDQEKPEDKRRNIKKGELKKKHRHYVLRYKNPRSFSSVLSEFVAIGVDPHDVEPARNTENSLCYLVHYGEDDKAKYDLSDVFGSPSLKKVLERSLSKMSVTEEEALVQIVEIIDSFDCTKYIRLDSLIRIVIDCGYLGAYKKYYGLIRDIVREHNIYGKELKKSIDNHVELDV